MQLKHDWAPFFQRSVHFVAARQKRKKENWSKNVALHNRLPYKLGWEVNDKRIQKWVLRGSNWEWNRFFRERQPDLCCPIGAASCCETRDWQFSSEFSYFKCQICQKLNLSRFAKNSESAASLFQHFREAILLFLLLFAALIWCW